MGFFANIRAGVVGHGVRTGAQQQERHLARIGRRRVARPGDLDPDLRADPLTGIFSGIRSAQRTLRDSSVAFLLSFPCKFGGLLYPVSHVFVSFIIVPQIEFVAFGYLATSFGGVRV